MAHPFSVKLRSFFCYTAPTGAARRPTHPSAEQRRRGAAAAAALLAAAALFICAVRAASQGSQYNAFEATKVRISMEPLKPQLFRCATSLVGRAPFIGASETCTSVMRSDPTGNVIREFVFTLNPSVTPEHANKTYF